MRLGVDANLSRFLDLLLPGSLLLLGLFLLASLAQVDRRLFLSVCSLITITKLNVSQSKRQDPDYYGQTYVCLTLG